jgi:hypothetical protein
MSIQKTYRDLAYMIAWENFSPATVQQVETRKSSLSLFIAHLTQAMESGDCAVDFE